MSIRIHPYRYLCIRVNTNACQRFELGTAKNGRKSQAHSATMHDPRLRGHRIRQLEATLGQYLPIHLDALHVSSTMHTLTVVNGRQR